MLISVIIPCYKSAVFLEKVIDELKVEFERNKEYSYQIILVNDCSPDNTFEIIKNICKNDRNIVGINLSRNFGQAAAKLAALPYVDGEVAVFMDDDGQHPAKGIFSLVDKINDGYDVVYAKFENKKHSWFKRVTSRLHRKIEEWTGNKPKGIFLSSFTAWSRFAVDSISNYHSPFPSAGSFLYNITTKIANVNIEHRERISGYSGYTLKKLFNLWLTTFTNFSIVPLRMASLAGVICSCFGFIFGIIVVFRKLINPSISAGYTSTIAIILFLGGMIMMLLGLLGEYIGRIYMTLSNLPQYVVRETINKKEVK